MAASAVPTRAQRRSGPKPNEGLLEFSDEKESTDRQAMVARIIAAVCLALGIHRSFLLRKQKGRCETKRSMARNTLALLIEAPGPGRRRPDTRHDRLPHHDVVRRHAVLLEARPSSSAGSIRNLPQIRWM